MNASCFLTFIFCWVSILAVKGHSSCKGYDCFKEYVDKKDSVYEWSDTGHRLHGLDPLHLKSWTGYVLNFTSQQWLTPEDSSRSIWWHYLVIIVPKEIKYPDQSFLWIASVNAGNMEDDMPSALQPDILLAGDFAVQAQTPAAVVFHVPNQPIVFPNDPLGENHKRTENAVLAYTWWHYMFDPEANPEWVIRLPMAKAAVRAMDTVTAYMTSESAPEEIKELKSNPGQFIVGGASKRGFATWSTGAVDPRVIAIVPIVMDELNFVKNMHHHFRAYGGWSFALDAFYKMNVTNMLDDEKFQQMQDIVDVYEYRDKLLMPKMVISTAGDEFFILDNSRWWWQDMPMKDELNKLLVVPNTEHVEITGFLEELPAAVTWAIEILRSNNELIEKVGKPTLETIDDRNSWTLQLAENYHVPKYNWTVNEDTGDITVYAFGSILPSSVHLWHSTTCDNTRRDFRLIHGHGADEKCSCGFPLPEQSGQKTCANLGVLWTSKKLSETSPGSQTYTAHMEPTDGKWTAFFVDLQYEKQEEASEGRGSLGWPYNNQHFEFTTTVSIIPNTYPYPECYGDSCFGKLV